MSFHIVVQVTVCVFFLIFELFHSLVILQVKYLYCYKI